VANFIWNPFKPFLGQTITLDSASSFDLDGSVVAWDWQIRDSKGVLITKNTQLTNFIGGDATYTVTLRVRDNEGLWGAPNGQVINVHIAKLETFVTHTPEWRQRWQDAGFDPDVAVFHAGENSVIELTSTPANRVWGTIHFGGKVREVDIPSSLFTLVKSEPYKMVWRAELWRVDFDSMKKEHMFSISIPYIQFRIQSLQLKLITSLR
jgi:hypothetical protein